MWCKLDCQNQINLLLCNAFKAQNTLRGGESGHSEEETLQKKYIAKVGTVFTFNGVLHDFNVDDDDYEHWRYCKVSPWQQELIEQSAGQCELGYLQVSCQATLMHQTGCGKVKLADIRAPTTFLSSFASVHIFCSTFRLICYIKCLHQIT